MANKTSTILKQVENLEKNLQRLKITAVLSLSEKKLKSIYPEKSLLKAIRNSRKVIWKKRYAQKI